MDDDSVFILLPGSEITSEGIELLEALSTFDPYMLRSKLKIQVPQLLFSYQSEAILGPTGDALEASGIRYLAVKRRFFEQPFQPFFANGCRFHEKSCQFYSLKNSIDGADSDAIIDIINDQQVLLLEGLYLTTGDEIFPLPTANGFAVSGKRKPEKSVYSKDVKHFRIIMLYRIMNPDPIVFIDRNLNYEFLGSDKEMTVTVNFDKFKAVLGQKFNQTIDQSMLQNAFMIEQDQQIAEKKTSSLKIKQRSQHSVSRTSNKDATDRMSRLIFFKWCKDNGWVDRVMPAG